MIEENPQFSDETIRRFLLGGLDATEQTALEQSLFTDGELEERVRLAELELSDDYAASRLSESERNMFETGFLLTDSRQRQLNVSQTLQGTLSQSSLRVEESIRDRFINLFDLRRHAWKYAFGVLILALLIATALLVRKERSQIVRDGGLPHHASPRPSPTQAPQEGHHPNNPGAPTHSEDSPQLPLHEDSTPSVVLNSNTPLEAAPVIKTNGDVVTIELRLDQPFADSYDINVMTTAGESLFIENAIKRTEGETLGFDVPASAIESGEFQVVVVRADSEPKQRAGVYYFRVR